MKSVRILGSYIGLLMPFFRPLSMHFSSHAMFCPKTRMVCKPSLSLRTSSGVKPCTEFACHAVFRGEEQTVQERNELPRRCAVIDGRADDDSVELVQALLHLLHEVVAKAMPRLGTAATGDTASYCFLTQIQQLCFYAARLQGGFHFVQGSISASSLVRAAVNQ